MLLPYLVQLKDAAAPLTAFLHPGVSVLSEYCAAVGMDGDYFWRLLKSWLDPLREIGCAFLQCSSLTAWSYQHGFASTNRGWEWFCPMDNHWYKNKVNDTFFLWTSFRNSSSSPKLNFKAVLTMKTNRS